MTGTKSSDDDTLLPALFFVFLNYVHHIFSLQLDLKTFGIPVVSTHNYEP